MYFCMFFIIVLYKFFREIRYWDIDVRDYYIKIDFEVYVNNNNDDKINFS